MAKKKRKRIAKDSKRILNPLTYKGNELSTIAPQRSGFSQTIEEMSKNLGIPQKNVIDFIEKMGGSNWEGLQSFVKYAQKCDNRGVFLRNEHTRKRLGNDEIKLPSAKKSRTSDLLHRKNMLEVSLLNNIFNGWNTDRKKIYKEAKIVKYYKMKIGNEQARKKNKISKLKENLSYWQNFEKEKERFFLYAYPNFEDYKPIKKMQVFSECINENISIPQKFKISLIWIYFGKKQGFIKENETVETSIFKNAERSKRITFKIETLKKEISILDGSDKLEKKKETQRKRELKKALGDIKRENASLK